MSLADTDRGGPSSASAAAPPLSNLCGQLHDAWVALLLTILVCRAVWPAFEQQPFGIEVSPSGHVTIRDLPAHLTFARTFWTTGIDYRVASHLRATDKWAGRPVDRALPFGYSPTMLLVLGPFCLLPSPWGYVTWSLLTAAAAWWLTRRGRSLLWVTPLVLLSPLGLACFLLGQTAFLAAAAIVWLMIAPRQIQGQASRSSGWRRTLSAATLLWLLTAKPPLALAAGTALLAQRRWRPVVGGVALTAATTLALTPLLGWNWPAQYVQMISSYHREAADAAFAWSLRPDHMSNLRSLLWYSGLVGDALAVRLATLVWLATLAGLGVWGLRGRVDGPAIWPLAVLSFLLFCPHVSSTEDLLLVVVVAALVPPRDGGWGRPQALIAALALLVVWLAPEVLVSTSAARSAVLLSAKLGIAATWLYLARPSAAGRQSAGTSPPAPGLGPAL